MIEIENVYKSYYSSSNIEYPALLGVSLKIKPGELTGIVGASGAGKSTLLHILSGLENYDRGSVKISNRELKNYNEKELSSYRNTTIGIVLQNFALISDFNVYNNVVLPLKFSKKHYKKNELKEKVNNLLALMGIKELIYKNISELSGGEKQRVAIARALITDPKYIFADEPTGSLDSQNTKKILDVFKSITQKGVGVVIVTHDKAVADMCDVVYKMKDGVVFI